MRSRTLLPAILAGLLVLSAASAAMASSAQQEVEVRTFPAGLSISVDHDIHLGDVAPGLSTAPRDFGLDIFNMTGDSWKVTIDAPDLVGGWWECEVEREPDGHCPDEYHYFDPLEPAQTLDAALLKVTGGDIDVDDYDQLTESPITVKGVDVPAKGGNVLLEGNFTEHHYHLHLQDPHSSMRFDLTDATSVVEAHYRTTVTYTIVAVEP